MAIKTITYDDVQSQGTGFKHEETTRNIVLHLLNEYGDPVRPDATHTWVAKVSDGSKYVGDFKVKIDNTDIVVDSEDFTQLPPNAINDDYYLEVWETWEDGDNKETSIYPSPKDTIQFHIYPNIQDQDTTEIQKIGFQQLVNVAVEQAGLNLVVDANSLPAGEKASVKQVYKDGKNYVTFNVPAGPKGDKGNDGDSSYEVWVKNGHSGSVQEYLQSLVGKKGDTGDPGLPAKISGIEVSTLPAGSQATADVVKGDENSYLIKLSIPKGDTGGQVIKPSLTISDVQALPYDQAPTVSLKLTGENSYALSVGIPVGQPGADGKSTYQIWLDEGNSGTEQDFLKSLIPDVSGIQKTADNANSTAQEAVDTANSAKTTANEAKSNADVAINTANKASETASTASSLASGASEAASDAAAKANEAQSTAEQALAKEPDLSPYLTSKDAADTYATKASVPTVVLDADSRTLTLNGTAIDIPEPIDLSGYATKNELPQVTLDTSNKTISVNGQSISIPDSIDLSNYYTKEETDSRINAHKVDLTGYLTEESAAKTFATKAEIPVLDDYAKKADIPASPDLSIYETKSNATATYATKDALSGYAKKSDIETVKVDYDAIYERDKQYIDDAILNGKW